MKYAATLLNLVFVKGTHENLNIQGILVTSEEVNSLNVY